MSCSALSSNPNNTVEVYLNEEKIITVVVKKKGVKQDITGAEVHFTVRERPDACETVIDLDSTNNPLQVYVVTPQTNPSNLGKLRIQLSPADTFGAAVKASGVLTISGIVSDGETVEIEGKTYTWKSTLTDVDGYVFIGASPEVNLERAINRTGTPGVDYAASTRKHKYVTALAGVGTLAVTACEYGIDTPIEVSETMANGSWSSPVLTGGVPIALPPGDYSYDVWLILGGIRYIIIKPATFKVKQPVTILP